MTERAARAAAGRPLMSSTYYTLGRGRRAPASENRLEQSEDHQQEDDDDGEHDEADDTQHDNLHL